MALTRLQPGQTVTHNETWEVYDSLDQPFMSKEIIALLESEYS
jgi:hypothetical protein